MTSIGEESYKKATEAALALCPVFGLCGGCSYQDMAYPDELQMKRQWIIDALADSAISPRDPVYPIVASPRPYHYRNRLDLKLKRVKDKGILIGFSPEQGKGVVPVDACPIADPSISDFIPELKREAARRLPEKYRMANLVVRSGEGGKVFWGGIGRKSCRLSENNYFWTTIEGRKIFYSLDTFFQANLSILPELFYFLRALPLWTPPPIFYDLYGGVGVFSVGLNDLLAKVVLIEENLPSVECARYNVVYNNLVNFRILDGRVEDALPSALRGDDVTPRVVMVDPPRSGLSAQALTLLASLRGVSAILYLSCNPESLVRDLRLFIDEGWVVTTVAPFDFFPKTRHLETLVVLRR